MTADQKALRIAIGRLRTSYATLDDIVALLEPGDSADAGVVALEEIDSVIEIIAVRLTKAPPLPPASCPAPRVAPRS